MWMTEGESFVRDRRYGGFDWRLGGRDYASGIIASISHWL